MVLFRLLRLLRLRLTARGRIASRTATTRRGPRMCHESARRGPATALAPPARREIPPRAR